MKYYIIAGEASGDLHGGNLIRAIREQDPQAEFRYWGGDKMQNAAQTAPVRHIRELAIMGFVEVVTHLRTVLGNIRFCKQDLMAYHPDVVVYIDYPGFNLKIAKFAHQHGFKNVHYISPQLWAWKKGRIKTMRQYLDKLCYILPFEQDFYAKEDFPQAVYVGHPLLDAIAPIRNGEGKSQQDSFTLLLPGSRRQEIKRMLPVMLSIADRHPQRQFRIAGMSIIGKEYYQRIIGKRNNVFLDMDTTYERYLHADTALVCSGTATLECALYGIPQVVCYSANALSIAIARKFVGKRIKYISLVNLIADRPVVTELIQNDLTPDRLNAEFSRITTDTAWLTTLQDNYNYIWKLLGDAGASKRCATEIIETAQSRPKRKSPFTD